MPGVGAPTPSKGKTTMKLSFSFENILKSWPSRGTARMVCWLLLFVPFALYFLVGSNESLGLPQTLDVEIVIVAAALGGLVLNASLNLESSKRKETIRVAQKFIAVVILMIIFLPVLHVVELMKGIDLSSFEPDSMEAWVRGFFFWLGAISFYVGISLFIIALVDLVYAMIGLEGVKSAFMRHGEVPDPSDSCDKGSNRDIEHLTSEDVPSKTGNGTK